jgi:dihydropteroate synthase
MIPDRPAQSWVLNEGQIALDKPVILGIINLTPDSFSDGGEVFSPDAAIARAERLLEEGADVLDLGGESTRPQGATPVSAEEELRRVLPVVEALRRRFPDALLSLDTVKSAVADVCLDAGAHIINDVSGFRLDPDIGAVCARHRAGVILMHSRGSVSEMGTYRYAEYGADVTGEVVAELRQRVATAVAAGVARDAIVVDPGIGFAKRSEHSLRILSELPRMMALGRPVLVGVSRKRFIGEVTGVQEPAERVYGTVGASVIALARGARLFRVHDVRPARHALDVAWRVLAEGSEA